LGSFLEEFLRGYDPAGFYFLLLATVIGTLTGVLISRNLTRRLRKITQASDAWSLGDLEVRLRDNTNDEVGQLAQDLNSMAGQLQSLMSTRQQLAVVEERNRLARELHDSVKQHVFANALLVRAARKVLADEPRAAEKYLAEAAELADEAQQGLVELIQALRPASVADKGLAVVLRDYANDWSKRMGIPVDVRILGERATPLDVEEALYRVGQECFANIARHSDAQEVSMRLEWAEDELCLTITDNGKGFDVRRVEGKGLGLVSMGERVEALHGTLRISSSPAGTVVQASIPLPTVAPAAVPTGMATQMQERELADIGKGRAEND
jgi:NarL family two-component system sensor histidine kinase LiaS